MTKKSLFFSFIILLIFTNCSKESDNSTNILTNMNTIKNVTQNQWDTLASKKIYFGHQSVGYNIMDGVEIILKENPDIKLNVKKGKDLKLFQTSVFAHDNNGSNGDPKSKIDDFCKTLENGLGNNVDMVGFKFCYVDFKKGTDVFEIFSYYKSKMGEISLKYPKVRIVHYTIPLRSIQTGPKTFIKKIIGKDIGFEDNIIRNEFNELIRSEYNKENIFDIARFESTYPDGKREFKEIKGKRIFTMIPTYTYDGGHLSKKGKLYLGKEYLLFLTNK